MNTRTIAQPFPVKCLRYGSHECVRVVRSHSGGFRVAVDIPPDFREDLWEHVEHFALFADRADAEALANAIRKRMVIDLSAFVWSPSRCTPFAALQVTPTAKRETSPRPSTGRNSLSL